MGVNPDQRTTAETDALRELAGFPWSRRSTVAARAASRSATRSPTARTVASVPFLVAARLERYSEWNPSLPSIVGDLRVGSTVSLTLAMPGRPSPKVKARLTEVVPQRRLRWHGNVGADWLFAGDRDFVIDEADHDAVNITHVEESTEPSSRYSACSWAALPSATTTGSTPP